MLEQAGSMEEYGGRRMQVTVTEKHGSTNKKGLLSARVARGRGAGTGEGAGGMMREKKIGARLTWNVSSEQKLITLPRRRGTMCCPAACESSQTDLRFTFRTCWRQYVIRSGAIAVWWGSRSRGMEER